MKCYISQEKVVITRIKQGKCIYHTRLKSTTDTKSIPFDQIYVTTSDDLLHQSHALDAVDKSNILQLISNKHLPIKQMPLNIGFQENLDMAIAKFTEEGFLRIAIINAMSSALGDHMVGMVALNIFYEELCKYIPPEKIIIDLLQGNPLYTTPITIGWLECYDNIIELPVTLQFFMNYNAYIDFGALVLHPNFNTQPLIDFFLMGLSINPNHIENDRKIPFYEIPTSQEWLPNILMQRIKEKAKNIGRNKILLFHYSASTPIRSMQREEAIKVIEEITQHTNYFVISALDLDFKHPYFLNIHQYSKTIDDFASIIASVDYVITVDTFTYHLAAAFNVSSLVLFTTIPPINRIAYYPNVKGMFLENENGEIFGQHMGHSESQIKYVRSLWQNLNMKEVVKKITI